MRLGYFGGSFDPPHRGHLAIALAAADRLSLDRVLLAPTGRQPFKRHGAAAGFADRLAMVELLCEDSPERLHATAIDAPHPDGSLNFTAETLMQLHATHPAAELFAIIGADNLLELPHWRDFPKLIDLAQWIAVSRPGSSVPATLPTSLERAKVDGRLHLITGVQFPIASRELRAVLRSPEPLAPSVCESLPAPVLRYIRQHHLYADRGTLS